jgi:hypothetical protein
MSTEDPGQPQSRRPWKRSEDRSESWHAYFEAIAEYAPDKLRALRDVVLPQWRAFLEGISDPAAGDSTELIEPLPDEPRLTTLCPHGDSVLVNVPDKWRPPRHFSDLVVAWLAETGIMHDLDRVVRAEGKENVESFEKICKKLLCAILPFEKKRMETTELQDSPREQLDLDLYRKVTLGLVETVWSTVQLTQPFLADWVYPVVWKTIHEWLREGVPDDSNLRWHYPSWLTGGRIGVNPPWNVIVTVDPDTGEIKESCIPEEFTFKIRRWNPDEENREEGTRRITQEFNRKLQQEMNDLERLLRESNLTRAEVPPDDECFKWLVQWQMLDMTKTQIRDQADSDGLDAKTITRGINRAAKAVYGHNWESWLRKGDVGRPPKESA